MTTVRYDRRTVGIAGPGYAFLLPDMLAAPAARFLHAMCIYALDVESGLIDGPYRQDDAEAFARAYLIDPGMLKCRDDTWLAGQLGVPVKQIRLAREQLLHDS